VVWLTVLQGREVVVAEPRYVRIVNNCDETVTVHRRFPRPKKSLPAPRRITPLKLKPQHASSALPYHELVGADGWSTLIKRPCIEVMDVEYEPRFVELLNTSGAPLQVELQPAHREAAQGPVTVLIGPKDEPRIIDAEAFANPDELRRLVEDAKVRIKPVVAIGPPTGLGRSVASFGSESVYVCNECGGPIVFRGSPPHPVHI